MNKYILLAAFILGAASSGCSTISKSVNEYLDTGAYCASESKYMEVFNRKADAVKSEVKAVKVRNLRYDTDIHNCRVEFELSDGSSIGGYFEYESWVPNMKHPLTPVEDKILDAQNAQARQLAEQNAPVARYNKALARCGTIGAIYQIAASLRNANRRPEDALNAVYNLQMITLEEKKSIINQVYFDPAFERAWGDALSKQMEESCMKESMPKGANNWEPLK